jgi:hypothetical protein
MDEIINEITEYIMRSYSPLSIIVYGSFADGSSGSGSDFDALVVSKDHGLYHDVSSVAGVRLDVFVYPASYFQGGFDCGDFIQLLGGRIVFDTGGCGQAVKDSVLEYVDELPGKTADELRAEIEWCKKMLLRAERAGEGCGSEKAEGDFRRHWLLTDSLEIFCDICGEHYLGPKKSLRWMEARHPREFGLYARALGDAGRQALADWVQCLENEFRG